MNYIARNWYFCYSKSVMWGDSLAPERYLTSFSELAKTSRLLQFDQSVPKRV